MKTHKFHTLLLTVFAFLICAAADTAHGVRVQLVDADQKPLAGVRVALELYEYGDETVTIHYVGRCTTDETGQCLIGIARPAFDAAGFLRGQIIVGEYGNRALIWPGGVLNVPVWLDVENALDVARETQPYEGQAQAVDLRIVDAPRLRLPDIIIPLVVFGGLLIYFLSKHKSNLRGNDEQE